VHLRVCPSGPTASTRVSLWTTCYLMSDGGGGGYPLWGLVDRQLCWLSRPELQGLDAQAAMRCTARENIPVGLRAGQQGGGHHRDHHPGEHLHGGAAVPHRAPHRAVPGLLDALLLPVSPPPIHLIDRPCTCHGFQRIAHRLFALDGGPLWGMRNFPAIWTRF